MIYLVIRSEDHNLKSDLHPELILDKAFILEAEAKEYCSMEKAKNSISTSFFIMEAESLSINDEISAVFCMDVSSLETTIHPVISLIAVYDEKAEADNLCDEMNEHNAAWYQYEVQSCELI